ncbi:hypothetical protein ACP70R_026492 [Stipagrostis hirtigluma subsp. patula]
MSLRGHASETAAASSGLVLRAARSLVARARNKAVHDQSRPCFASSPALFIVQKGTRGTGPSSSSPSRWRRTLVRSLLRRMIALLVSVGVVGVPGAHRVLQSVSDIPRARPHVAVAAIKVEAVTDTLAPSVKAMEHNRLLPVDLILILINKTPRHRIRFLLRSLVVRVDGRHESVLTTATVHRPCDAKNSQN